MSKVGLLAIHGMGSQKRDFAKGLFTEISDRLSKQQNRQLVTGSIFYQDILEPNEKAYYDKTKRKLQWRNLRQFILYGFCDAASLESQKAGPTSPYFQAQKKIFDALAQMQNSLEKNAPIVVVAQSLGCQVFSNYLWDATLSVSPSPAHGVWADPPQMSKELEKVCRGKTIQRLYTTGCNIPIFVAGRPAAQIKAIPKPNNKFRWENYYDKDDALGWPLSELSNSYKKLVKDKQINAGLFSGFTPLSHVNYWKDRDFLNPLAKDLKQLLS
ncbi:MAG: hypothetical protein RDA78_20350 [Roseibium sp.]|uniref:hypothetical protein n=1 Tax=Roseibium sp. TaxID=1936156 RepID=UPI003D9C59FD